MGMKLVVKIEGFDVCTVLEDDNNEVVLKYAWEAYDLADLILKSAGLETLDEMRKEIDRVEELLGNAQGDVTVAREKCEELMDKIDELESKIEDLEDEADDLRDKIFDLEEIIEDLSE